MVKEHKGRCRDKSTRAQPGKLNREPQGVDASNAPSVATPEAGRKGLGCEGLEGAASTGRVGQGAVGVAESAVHLADEGEGGVGEQHFLVLRIYKLK